MVKDKPHLKGDYRYWFILVTSVVQHLLFILDTTGAHSGTCISALSDITKSIFIWLWTVQAAKEVDCTTYVISWRSLAAYRHILR